jgi:hypothetical protein
VFEYWHGSKGGLLTRQELKWWLRPAQRDLEQLLERSDIERLSGSCTDIKSSWTTASRPLNARG